jgi:hypothetical protein
MINKKALLGFEEPLKIIDFIFLFAVVIVLSIFVVSFFSFTFDTSQAQAEVFANRILFSPTGLSYCSDRCYPGIVDYDIISNDSLFQERFSKAFASKSKSARVAFKIDFFNESNQVFKTSYYNEEWYKRWKPLEFKQFKNIQRSYYVLYYNNGFFHKGKLSVDLVMEVE